MLLEKRLHLFLLSLLEQFELKLLLPTRLRRHPNVRVHRRRIHVTGGWGGAFEVEVGLVADIDGSSVQRRRHCEALANINLILSAFEPLRSHAHIHCRVPRRGSACFVPAAHPPCNKFVGHHYSLASRGRVTTERPRSLQKHGLPHSANLFAMLTTIGAMADTSSAMVKSVRRKAVCVTYTSRGVVGRSLEFTSCHRTANLISFEQRPSASDARIGMESEPDIARTRSPIAAPELLRSECGEDLQAA